MVNEILDINDKTEISRMILESLKEWFEIEDAREKYILDSQNQIFFAAYEQNKPVGFLCLKETSKDTLEIAVTGVLKEYQRMGFGRLLFDSALQYAKDKGYSFIQVKTVATGFFDEYDETNKFYKKVGFKELEIITSIWGEENPCQIYIMSVN